MKDRNFAKPVFLSLFALYMLVPVAATLAPRESPPRPAVAAVGARKVPELNGYWHDDHFTAGEGVHLGVAISVRGGGLVPPAIHAADGLTPAELMASLKDLVTRARAGRLRRAGRAATGPAPALGWLSGPIPLAAIR